MSTYTKQRGRYQCIWCCKPTDSIPCQHCGNQDTVVDPTLPHRPHWSRATMHTVECLVCGRTGDHDIQLSDQPCPPTTPKNTPNQ